VTLLLPCHQQLALQSVHPHWRHRRALLVLESTARAVLLLLGSHSKAQENTKIKNYQIMNQQWKFKISVSTFWPKSFPPFFASWPKKRGAETRHVGGPPPHPIPIGL
jgi:hypothetical protein